MTILNLGVIKEVMNGSELKITMDVDKANELFLGKKLLPLGIPIKATEYYIPYEKAFDGYEGTRNWYRKNIQNRGVFAVHQNDIKDILSENKLFPRDSFDYLTVSGTERKPAWEGSNEAVVVGGWVFPANALNHASVSKDTPYNGITINVVSKGNSLGNIQYRVQSEGSPENPQKQIFYKNPASTGSSRL